MIEDELGNLRLGNGLPLLHYANDAGLDDDSVVPFGEGLYFLHVGLLLLYHFEGSLVCIINFV